MKKTDLKKNNIKSTRDFQVFKERLIFENNATFAARIPGSGNTGATILRGKLLYRLSDEPALILTQVNDRLCCMRQVEPGDVHNGATYQVEQDNLKLSPQQQDWVLLSHVAFELFESEQYQPAADIFYDLLSIDPRDHYTLSFLSRCASKLGLHQHALDIAKRALKCAPENQTALTAWGFALEEVGRYPEAIMVLKKLIYLSPKNSRAEIRLGVLLLFLDKPAEAEPVIRSAFRQYPNNSEAQHCYAALGTYLSSVGRIAPAKEILHHLDAIVSGIKSAEVLESVEALREILEQATKEHGKGHGQRERVAVLKPVLVETAHPDLSGSSTEREGMDIGD